MPTKVQYVLLAVVTITVYCSDSTAITPTFDEINRARQSGHLTEAQAMTEVFLRADPNSALAHFIDAQILAQQGRVDYATTELQAAQRLSPGLSFANPSAVAALEAQLRIVDVAASSSEMISEYQQVRILLWGIVTLGIALIIIAIFLATRRNPYGAYGSTGDIQQ